MTSGRNRIARDDRAAALLPLAAKGDADAQAGLVDFSYEQFRTGAVTFQHAVAVAEAWARLAATHGRPDDLRKLAAVLTDAALVALNDGDTDDAALHIVDASTLLDDLADDGDVGAVAMLERLRDSIGSEAMRKVAAAVRDERASEEGEGG